MTITEKIVKFLRENLVEVELLNHEPVYTSEQAARVRGLSIKMGAKSLLLKADNDFLLAVLPGDQKLDSKKLREILGTKQLRFARPEEVKQVMECEIGACYPFGNLVSIKMLVDKKLAQQEMISFNPGVHNKSIKISWEDYQRVVNPKLVDISKSG